eukprot:1956759-Pleurochrysis_carterae.AAC.1
MSVRKCVRAYRLRRRDATYGAMTAKRFAVSHHLCAQTHELAPASDRVGLALWSELRGWGWAGGPVVVRGGLATDFTPFYSRAHACRCARGETFLCVRLSPCSRAPLASRAASSGRARGSRCVSARPR